MASVGSPASRPDEHACPPPRGGVWGLFHRHAWSGVNALLDGWRGLALLLALCAAVYVPGQAAIPAVDRDESRFAQATHQMVAGDSWHDWVVPMLQDVPRINKPPLIYWLQGASVEAFTALGLDEHIWMYRLPSALAATLTVLMVWRWGARMFSPAAGFLAGAMLAVAPIVAWEAHQARSDMVLLACTTLAMWMLWEVWSRRRRWEAHDRSGRCLTFGPAMAFWLAMALGVMVKGPITPMVAGLTALGLSVVGGRWRWLWALRPLAGVLIVAAVVSPWVYLVMREVGTEVYLREIYDEVIGRSKAPKEGHWGPPGYHLVLMPVLFWPGCVLTGLAFVRAVQRGLRRSGRFWVAPGRPGELFLLAWITPSWLVFELVSTKLPHYTMPLYPALALLTSRLVIAAMSPHQRSVPELNALGPRAGFALWGFIGLALAAGPIALWWAVGEPTDLSSLLLASGTSALVIAGTLGAAKALLRGNLRLAMPASILGAAALCVGLFQFVLPRLDQVWITRALMREVVRIEPAQERPLGTVEYHEDSLIFATRGRARRLDAPGIDAFLEEHPRAMVIMPVGEAQQRPGLRRLAEVSGFNYSNGRRFNLVIVDRPEPTPPGPPAAPAGVPSPPGLPSGAPP